MAISKAKRSHSLAQSRAPKSALPETPKQEKKPRRKHRELPLLPPPVVTRRGKTTIRQFSGRAFHRMEEVKGKVVEYVEIYNSGDYHSIDIRFQDKTALHFVIDPGFLLETEYDDWKTGNFRRIKRWPVIRSA
jgi:hypothetical protein